MCPVCSNISYTDHHLYTHVFEKQYDLTEIDFSKFPLSVSKNVSEVLPGKELYTYALFEEKRDTEYSFKDPDLIDVVVKLAINRHLQTYLNTSERLGDTMFLTNLVLNLTNKKANNNNQVVNNPYIGQNSMISRRSLDEDTVSSLINAGRYYILRGDNRGSGYQFYTFHTLMVRIKNNPVQFINHFYGGKRKRNEYIIDEAIEDNNIDEEILDDRSTSTDEEETEEDLNFINDDDVMTSSSFSSGDSSTDSSDDDTIKLIRSLVVMLKKKRKRRRRSIEGRNTIRGLSLLQMMMTMPMMTTI